jgi:hypothetical protein
MNCHILIQFLDEDGNLLRTVEFTDDFLTITKLIKKSEATNKDLNWHSINVVITVI